MMIPKCPKCGGTNFKAQLITLGTQGDAVDMICCTVCETTIGVVGNASRYVNIIDAKIKDMEQSLLDQLKPLQ